VDPAAIIMALAGAAVAAGLAVWVLPAPASSVGPTGRRTARLSRAVVVRVLIGVAAGIVVGWVTHWPVAGLASAAAVVALRGLFSGPSQAAVVARLEAIASWTEGLRDLISVGMGPTEALQKTAQVTVGPLAAPLARMDLALTLGTRPADALRELGAELKDPTADMVLAVLIMTLEHDASKIVDVLHPLAAEARAEASQRREVDAARASSRSEMRTVTIGSVAFMGLFWLVGHNTPLLRFYAGALGQAVLAAVAVIIGVGIWLMARLVRPRQAELMLLSEQDT
jgi:tight adherence protein B